MPYRFCFLLTTTVGNQTRYVNLRRYAEQDRDVEFSWVPLSSFPPPRVARAFRALPNVWVARFWLLWQLLPAFLKLRRFDAVMVHQFEAEMLLALRRRLTRSPLVVSSTDEAPAIDEATYPLYEQQRLKSARRRRLRLRNDLWRCRNIDFFIPFTKWAADILERGCAVPKERIHPIHVGLDLKRWASPQPRSTTAGQRLRILFVGGDFERKGGSLLLRVFQNHFSGVAELHIVSSQAPPSHSADVFVYPGFPAGDDRLVRLYADCDVLAVPTEADLIPWVYMEAMAMGMPCIGTTVGAISEVIEDGVTGLLIPPSDEAALASALRRLIDDPHLRERMGAAGRRKVELEYDAAKNVPRILAAMKSLVDRSQHRRAEQPGQ